MTYYAGFELFAIRDHNEEVLREVSKLRLEKRLREARQPQSGPQFVYTLRRMLPAALTSACFEHPDLVD